MTRLPILPDDTLDMDKHDPAQVLDPREAEVSRRSFLKVAGASAIMASAAGCVRKPVEYILPYGERPEDFIPGKARYFATCAWVGGQVQGLLVESQDGRPIKAEGNPDHPTSGGATSLFAQGFVLDLYDPDRGRGPLKAGSPSSKADALAAVKGMISGDGSGTAVLSESTPSPTRKRLLDELVARHPGVKVYVFDPRRPVDYEVEAISAMGATTHRLRYSLRDTDVVLALDSDFMGAERESVRLAAEFADGRRAVDNKKSNRLYVVEPSNTLTGVLADNRLRLKSAQVGPFLEQVAKELTGKGVTLPPGAEGISAKLKGGDFGNWPAEVAADLAAHRGRSAIIPGNSQPAAVHALALALNTALGNVKQAEIVPARAEVRGGSITELAAALRGGQVSNLLVLGGNPVYSAPADLGFGELIGKAGTSAYLGLHKDETGAAATWYLPESHALESWGDLSTVDGTGAVCQPLIAPIFDAELDGSWGTFTAIELLGTLLDANKSDYELVQDTWRPVAGGEFDKAWQRWLHNGVVDIRQAAPFDFLDWTKAAALFTDGAAADGIEVRVVPSYTVDDGRYINNAWLQETPDPLTKITWDNAAVLSPATAEKVGVDNGDLVDISVGDRKLSASVWVQGATADDTVTISLGYGRSEELFSVGGGAGFNAAALRTTAAPYFASGGSISKGSGRYELASTQRWGFKNSDDKDGVEFLAGLVSQRMTGYPHIRQADLDTFAGDHFDLGHAMPGHVKHAVHGVEPGANLSLWEDEAGTQWWEKRDISVQSQQWGMTFDLNVCNGCSACITACTAENNVPAVGKDNVLQGREMHWLRLDTYMWDDAPEGDDPDAVRPVVLPVACAHCETAPCEQVCPVAATSHSPEGLNDIAYNRCIGTRYCANNCPTKVRRFNFFNYTKRNDEAAPMYAWQRNPDVTVRFRGVIEKCSYCVQRIQEAKIEARRDAAHGKGDGRVADGRINPACAQVCPTKAITFGDITDADSMVSKAKASPRNYVVLEELNIHPRTSYLARIRNPNNELLAHKVEHHGDAAHGSDHGDDHGDDHGKGKGGH